MAFNDPFLFVNAPVVLSENCFKIPNSPNYYIMYISFFWFVGVKHFNVFLYLLNPKGQINLRIFSTKKFNCDTNENTTVPSLKGWF